MTALLAALLLGASPGPGALGDTGEEARQAPRDGAELGTRLAEGPYVVLATAIRVGAKERFRIDRFFRGDGLGPVVRIDARQANATRPVDAPPFEARRGESAIFVLEPARDYRDDLRGADILQPANGFRSKIPVPAEGAPALLDAVERLVEYQDSENRGLVEARLVEWLEGRNPWLVDFAVDQAARFGLAGARWIPGLLALTRAADPWHRMRAVEALGAALERDRMRRSRRLRRQSPLAAEEADEALRTSREAIIRLARTDDDVRVRIAAVRAVPRSGHGEARRVLRAISREDADQEVRYEAAAGLQRLRERPAGRQGSLR